MGSDDDSSTIPVESKRKVSIDVTPEPDCPRKKSRNLRLRPLSLKIEDNKEDEEIDVSSSDLKSETLPEIDLSETLQGQKQEEKQESDGSVFGTSESEAESEPESESESDPDIVTDPADKEMWDREKEMYKREIAISRKDPSDLTAEEVISLCAIWDRERASEVADKIKHYLVKLRKSVFDIEMEDFPGFFYTVTSICPYPVSRVDYPDDYLEYENMAKLAISKYNRTHGTVFKVAEVVRVSSQMCMYRVYYITFDAVDLQFRGSDRSTECTTFQAIGSANKVNTKEKPRISSCKIKKAN